MGARVGIATKEWAIPPNEYLVFHMLPETSSDEGI
jgi:hypothetical protein